MSIFILSANDPAEFSLIALINEARVASEWEDPKSAAFFH
jgi:hypothetical protein